MATAALASEPTWGLVVSGIELRRRVVTNLSIRAMYWSVVTGPHRPPLLLLAFAAAALRMAEGLATAVIGKRVWRLKG